MKLQKCSNGWSSSIFSKSHSGYNCSISITILYLEFRKNDGLQDYFENILVILETFLNNKKKYSVLHHFTMITNLLQILKKQLHFSIIAPQSIILVKPLVILLEKQVILFLHSPRKIQAFPINFLVRKFSVNEQLLQNLSFYGKLPHQEIRWKILYFTRRLYPSVKLILQKLSRISIQVKLTSVTWSVSVTLRWVDKNC